MSLPPALSQWPSGLVRRVLPQPLAHPQWLWRNEALFAELGMAGELAEHAGNTARDDGLEATCYGGHQFGHWAHQLGDGRALMLGAQTSTLGARWELQLKGAGPTPYSRGGDGRAVLRSSIREALASEAMHALGIPTTRALCLVGSDTPVRREHIETAAIVTRAAPSFMRFGHWQWCNVIGDAAALQRLSDLAIAEHFAHLTPGDYPAWMREVLVRTATLMAQWQAVGFCHGVMNTDNFSVLGLTLDYGPYGFLDGFDAQHVCNHSDHEGRYRYNAQPSVGHWNCAQWVSACLSLLDPSHTPNTAPSPGLVAQGEDILAAYPDAYAQAMTDAWRAKLGLCTAQDDDVALINRWLSMLHGARADFTLAHRAITGTPAPTPPPFLQAALPAPTLAAWWPDYLARRANDASDPDAQTQLQAQHNPVLVLRNHHAQTVIAAAEGGDTAPLHSLFAALADPYNPALAASSWAAPPPANTAPICVSCSS